MSRRPGVADTKWCPSKYHSGPNPVPMTEFGRKAGNPYGLRYECRACGAAAAREWAVRNHERFITAKRARYRADAERLASESLARYNADPAYQAERIAAIQEETRENADHHGEPWEVYELEVALRDDLTAKESALMLGRTYGAVTGARRRYRRQQAPATLPQAAGASAQTQG